jgi:hypothetical protein
MTPSASRFDPASQRVLHNFACKLGFILLIAAGIALADIRQLPLVCTLLEVQCAISTAMSVALALSLQQRLEGPSLTYWDEAMAFSSVGILGHIGAYLLG